MWIIQDQYAGWPEQEAMLMRVYYDKLDREKKEQMKNREMFNLLALIGTSRQRKRLQRLLQININIRSSRPASSRLL